MFSKWLNSFETTLDEELDGGVIEGYITDARNDVQLENYLDDQGDLEALPSIQAKYTRVAIIKSMYVDEEERGNGIGNNLLQSFIWRTENRKAEAVVSVADTGEENEFDLVAWYERYGFEIVHGERNDFPVMVKELIGKAE